MPLGLLSQGQNQAKNDACEISAVYKKRTPVLRDSLFVIFKISQLYQFELMLNQQELGKALLKHHILVFL